MIVICNFILSLITTVLPVVWSVLALTILLVESALDVSTPLPKSSLFSLAISWNKLGRKVIQTNMLSSWERKLQKESCFVSPSFLLLLLLSASTHFNSSHFFKMNHPLHPSVGLPSTSQLVLISWELIYITRLLSISLDILELSERWVNTSSGLRSMLSGISGTSTWLWKGSFGSCSDRRQGTMNLSYLKLWRCSALLGWIPSSVSFTNWINFL